MISLQLLSIRAVINLTMISLFLLHSDLDPAFPFAQSSNNVLRLEMHLIKDLTKSCKDFKAFFILEEAK